MSNDTEKKEPVLLRVEDDDKMRVEIYTGPPTDEERAAARRFLDGYGAQVVQHVLAKNKKTENE